MGKIVLCTEISPMRTLKPWCKQFLERQLTGLDLAFSRKNSTGPLLLRIEGGLIACLHENPWYCLYVSPAVAHIALPLDSDKAEAGFDALPIRPFPHLVLTLHCPSHKAPLTPISRSTWQIEILLRQYLKDTKSAMTALIYGAS